jgi:hypothetical protein
VKVVETPSSDPQWRGRPTDFVWINPRALSEAKGQK